MSGIAGIINLKADLTVRRRDFDTFFSCVMINNCKEKVIKQVNQNSYIGLGDLIGNKPKYLNNLGNGTRIFIWGDVFIQGKENLKDEVKYNQIIQIWKEEKENLVNILTGFYVVIIYDEIDNRFFLFNSSFGMMPLYYSIIGETLFFSSRVQSFIDYEKFKTSLNRKALIQYLIFNYSIDDSTFVKDVKLLPSSTSISGITSWEISKYENHSWLLDSPILNEKDGLHLINQTLEKSIGKIASLNNKIGCALTGGWDGRLVLSYLSKKSNRALFLYTYGKESSPDMIIAKKLATAFNYHHVPVLLEDYFIKNYEAFASESMYLSSGLRAANRNHYIYMARTLCEKSNHVISGNCGSNILKIVQSPSPVYNKNVLKLFDSNNLEDTTRKIYYDFFNENPWINTFIGLDDFQDAILNSEIIMDKEISSNRRFYHYLITNIERKYFGTEASTYSSYIYNYTPFMDQEFVKAIVQTPYFGGHYNFLEKDPLIRYKLVKLYADLMSENNLGLAKFNSDRGFPITWFLTPYGRIAGFFKKKINSTFFAKIDDNPFNHNQGLSKLSDSWNQENIFFKFSQNNSFSETYIKSISWNYWYNKYFHESM